MREEMAMSPNSTPAQESPLDAALARQHDAIAAAQVAFDGLYQILMPFMSEPRDGSSKLTEVDEKDSRSEYVRIFDMNSDKLHDLADGITAVRNRIAS